MNFVCGVLCVVLAAIVCMPEASATASKRSRSGNKTVTSKSGTHAKRASTTHTSSTSRRAARRSAVKASSSKHSKKSAPSTKSARVRGQQGIDNDRAREIQEALIREKYLEGEPSGVWDQSTKDALTKYQKDNGWQNKLVPDSRALIKLGLGPNHQNVINPEASGVGESPATIPTPAARLQPGGGSSATQ